MIAADKRVFRKQIAINNCCTNKRIDRYSFIRYLTKRNLSASQADIRHCFGTYCITRMTRKYASIHCTAIDEPDFRLIAIM